MADGAPQYSYLVVGAGVFGVSTAYHLIKKFPTASVTIVDRDAYDAETRVAASWDWNKVVRADYDDIVYCKLALEAQDIFENDPLWQPHFHKTGIYWMCRSDYAQDVIDNYKKLGRSADLQAVPVEEARKLYGGLFEDADYSGVKEVLVNKTSGWVAAGDVLRAVTRECIKLGVKYIPADVASLQFDDEGHCSGVKTVLGNIISASHTIVCTGAFTPKLLEWSAQSSGNKELRAGSRIVAGGITTGMAKLGEEDYQRFKDMPVGVQGYTPKIGTQRTSLIHLTIETNIKSRTLHRQSPSNTRPRTEVVGPEDLQKHPRSRTRSFHICTSCRARLRAMESHGKTQGRHCIREPRLLRQEWCKLEHGEAPHLLVSLIDTCPL
jgi:hypothetical protein